MKLSSKVTGGLAWVGLVVILAVPSAEVLTKPPVLQAGAVTEVEPAAEATSSVKPATGSDSIETASIRNAPQRAAPAGEKKQGGDVVDAYVASGKKLPSYISDAPGATASTAVKPVTTPKLVVPNGADPVQSGSSAGQSTQSPAETGQRVDTASLPPAESLVAPVPYPASMRPKPPLASTERPLVLDEGAVLQREAGTASARPVPPAPVVTADQLEEWDSGSLADYLERKGLISEARGKPAREYEEYEEYDEDGFFLSDGPNSGRRLIGRYRDGWTLF